MKFEILIPIMVLTVASFISCSGKIPSNLGVKNGRLASCPDSPNCVSSQAEDPGHKIAPIAYKSSRDQARALLLEVIKSMKRAKIVTEKNNYIYAEYTSAFFRFVDDVEFYFPDSSGIIHVRSASRLGHSDLGVNRKRMERVRSLFERKNADSR